MNAVCKTVIALLVAISGVREAASMPDREPPSLLPRIVSGALPAAAERLPAQPFVVKLSDDGRASGAYGGTLRMLVDRPEDARLMVVYGYARLVGYDRHLELRPDILERLENEGDRVFTFHLRPGHRWSDGHPFTSEDFRFRWEDVFNDPDLSPGGVPAYLLVDGEPPKFEVIDDTTVRYSWEKPNHQFLPALAGASPEYVYQPSHYLKAFHARYAESSALAERVRANGARNWVALYTEKARQYRNTNPDLPSLQPWIRERSNSASPMGFVRNPYFHRVDENGRQLPYIGRVELTVVDPEQIPVLATRGGSDLQARGLGIEHFPMLKLAERHGSFGTRLWLTASGSVLALYPNFNVADPTWQEVVRNADFRRALSLGIDRGTINQLIYHGLGIESANTVLRESPVFEPEFEEAWADYDVDAANRLLDGIGLRRRPEDGMRTLFDGSPLAFEVAVSDENPTDVDVIRLIAETWSALGIDIEVLILSRKVLRSRALSGESVMSAWKGLENGVPGPNSVPFELAPHLAVQLHWPAWGEYVETEGLLGTPIADRQVARLVFLRKAWETAPDRSTRKAAWQSMLAWHAENVFTIGTVHALPQPVLVSGSLRNVPEEGIYNWEPGAYFGIYQPDTFWFEPVAGQ